MVSLNSTLPVAPLISPVLQSRGLLLHCGARAVAREALEAVPIPLATRTWQPVGHEMVLRMAEAALRGRGLSITAEAHSLTADGSRYFGLLAVGHASRADGFGWVLGIRNSHDKTFPAGLVAGMQVLVCDNLSFAGEVKLSRKHTRYVIRDLPHMAVDAVDRIRRLWSFQGDRVAAYRNSRLTEKSAHDLIIRAADAEAIVPRVIPKVLHEWREPSHAEFRPRSAWSLFNAFTEVMKGGLDVLPRRTAILHHLFDRHVGLQGQN